MTSRSVRLLHVTDLHLLADPAGTLRGVRTYPSFLEVLAHARAHFWPVDALLLTGDLVHDGSPAGYRRLRQVLEPLGVSAACIPGNHDDVAQMYTNLSAPRILNEGHLTLGEWRIILIDSTVVGADGGHLPPERMRSLEHELRSAEGHPVVLCIHHPPVATGSAWIDEIGLDNADALFDLLEDYPGVRLVVAGHVHQTVDVERGGVRVLTTPSTCFQFEPMRRSFALAKTSPAYRWLTLAPGGEVETGVEYVPAAIGADAVAT